MIGYGLLIVIAISLIGQCTMSDNVAKLEKADKDYLAKLTPEDREKELKKQGQT